MDLKRQLERISRIENKLATYREALEAVRRLEKDPELRPFLVEEPYSAVDAKKKTEKSVPTNNEGKGAKSEKQEKKTDQETLIALAVENLDGEFPPDTLLEVARKSSDKFFDDGTKLDAKKINDHLSRAVRDGKVFNGKRVERVKEGKRGRSGYPATYRVVDAEGEGGEAQVSEGIGDPQDEGGETKG